MTWVSRSSGRVVRKPPLKFPADYVGFRIVLRRVGAGGRYREAGNAGRDVDESAVVAAAAGQREAVYAAIH